DKRYRAFRSDYGNSVDRKFFTNVFQLQGILGVILSLPFLFACMNAETHIHPVEYSAFVLFLFSLFGEYLADKQLHRFKSDPANKGKVCDVGLWSMSRHPNYFFEWLIWISFALVAIASPFGFIGILSPVLMYIFLTRISGVKMTEEFAVKSRGESYLRYQKTTNAFFPWFKRAGL
ncbi:MAG: DUF1295 domain-containing protein, partial [Leptospira sp.]|nr:DUF1295 domain-containing protein [Leptospira sp.]